MQRRLFSIAGLSLIIIVLLIGVALRTPLARSLWTKGQSASLALALNTKDAGLAKEIGDYYFGGGAYDLSLAREAYEEALAIDPSLEWAHYQLARIYLVDGDLTRALAELNEELRLHPENKRSLYVRGLIFGFSYRYGEAEEDFKRFVTWAPTEWAGYNDLGWILGAEGKYEELRDLMEKAIETVPGGEQNAWFWNGLGVAYLNLGEDADALDALKKAEKRAAALTEDDWHRSYPGNDPASAKEGLTAFREAIATNIAAASGNVDN